MILDKIIESVVLLFSALGHWDTSQSSSASKQVEGLHKAAGLDLYKPQGALAKGQCALGKLSTPKSGPEWGQ